MAFFDHFWRISLIQILLELARVTNLDILTLFGPLYKTRVGRLCEPLCAKNHHDQKWVMLDKFRLVCFFIFYFVGIFLNFYKSRKGSSRTQFWFEIQFGFHLLNLSILQIIISIFVALWKPSRGQFDYYFQRKIVPELRRFDEMERKLRYLEIEPSSVVQMESIPILATKIEKKFRKNVRKDPSGSKFFF